jgi:hypothetical protein
MKEDWKNGRWMKVSQDGVHLWAVVLGYLLGVLGTYINIS